MVNMHIMAAGRLSSKLCVVLFLFLLFSGFRDHEGDPVHTTTKFYMGRSLTAPPSFETRTSKATRPDHAGKSSAPCLIPCLLELCNRSCTALCLIYLAGDLETNPGPPMKNICGVCLKTIRRNQSFVDCSVCSKSVHLKCFGPDYNSVMACRLCATHSESESEVTLDDCHVTLPQQLRDIPRIKGFKIVHQNIRSLTNKIDELRFLVSELKSGLHLLTLSETWTDEDITDKELEIAGYQIFRRDRPKGIRGGVAVYARNDLKILRRHDLEDPTIEGLWVEVFPPKSHSFLVGTFYRPQATSDYAVPDFMPILENCYQRATARGKEAIVTGDLNCDLLPSKTTLKECKQLKLLLKTENLSQFITQPTRITKHSKTLLDVIITNSPANIRDSGVLSLSLSDHEMVYCIRKLNWMKAPPEVKVFRNYAKYDPDKFSDELKRIDWNCEQDPSGTNVSEKVNVNELWTDFESKFLEVADRHAPLIQKTVRGLNSCPWITGNIKKDIRQRDYLLKKARKTSRDEDWLAYKSIRNRVSNSIKKAKQTYNKKLIENNQGDARAFWRTMKSILPGEKKSSPKTMDINGELCSDENRIANHFNSFFATAVSRMKQALGFEHSTNRHRTGHDTTTRSLQSFKFEKVSEAFVLKTIKQLKSGKASGLDNISPRLLKDSAEVIAKPLTCIINESLAQGVVPQAWKFAKVTPLFKKGVATDMDNYRPISVLPAVSKILEKVVHHQLYHFLSEHKLLSPFQCGFRKNHSTETAAIAFSDFVRRGMDQGQLTGAVFIDLRKAFDSVDHELLINKLATYGLSDNELSWFSSYLSERRQVVSVGKELSDPCHIISGVPQGSILGPLLFVLFINDLPESLVKCKVLMYADDTVLYFTASKAEEIGNTLTNDLANVENWLLDNSLFLHQGKTECVLFGTSARLSSANFAVYINGRSLNRVAEYKYLGVIMDECLTWKAHINYLLGKAGKRIGMLGRTRKNLSIETSDKVYRAFILPIIDYCDTVWNCCGAVNSNKLEKLQRRAARIIMKSNSSDKSLDHLKYELLADRRDKHVLNLVKKMLRKKCPQLFFNYFNTNKDYNIRTTRQSNHMRLPKIRLESTKKAFYYHGGVVFNKHL